MTERPRVSIVTPARNSARFIEGCILNVAAQDCTGIEHVIIDGASSDATVSIIREYADRYPHIRWRSEHDRGPGDALNKGISLARGPVVGLLMADDFYEQGVLARVREVFEPLPSPALAVANCRVWGKDGKVLYVNRPERLRLSDLLLGWKVHQIPVNPSAYFYHKELHQRIGLFTDAPDFDIDFIFRAVQAAYVVYVDEIWGNFRRLPGSVYQRELESGMAQVRRQATMRRYRRCLSLREKIRFPFRSWYYSHWQASKRAWRDEGPFFKKAARSVKRLLS
ncbi:MAG: glycosyltransferase [Candidatus Omnitrophica bacterium]|nr:glycosyltransferase [Candidatus Omnitrophota bacterium]